MDQKPKNQSSNLWLHELQMVKSREFVGLDYQKVSKLVVGRFKTNIQGSQLWVETGLTPFHPHLREIWAESCNYTHPLVKQTDLLHVGWTMSKSIEYRSSVLGARRCFSMLISVCGSKKSLICLTEASLFWSVFLWISSAVSSLYRKRGPLSSSSGLTVVEDCRVGTSGCTGKSSSAGCEKPSEV